MPEKWDSRKHLFRAYAPSVEPERMTRMAAQMRNVLFPDTKVQLQIWKMEEGKAYFRFVNLEDGKPILDRGVFEWK